MEGKSSWLKEDSRVTALFVQPTTMKIEWGIKANGEEKLLVNKCIGLAKEEKK